jgi:hypothetical protein
VATVDIGPLAVNGQLEAIVVDPVGDAPTNVIRRSDPFRVDCRWFLDGPLASSLGGKWRVELLGEGQGPAIEFEVPAAALIPLDGRTGPGRRTRRRSTSRRTPSTCWVARRRCSTSPSR